MVDNPILIERLIVIKGKKAVLGQPPSNIASLHLKVLGLVRNYSILAKKLQLI